MLNYQRVFSISNYQIASFHMFSQVSSNDIPIFSISKWFPMAPKRPAAPDPPGGEQRVVLRPGLLQALEGRTPSAGDLQLRLCLGHALAENPWKCQGEMEGNTPAMWAPILH